MQVTRCYIQLFSQNGYPSRYLENSEGNLYFQVWLQAYIRAICILEVTGKTSAWSGLELHEGV